MQNSFGEPVPDWADDFSVAAAFEPIGSSEFPMAHKRHAETTARFKIRYRKDIADDGSFSFTHRIRFNMSHALQASTNPEDWAWNITPPIPVDGRNIELEIEANKNR